MEMQQRRVSTARKYFPPFYRSHGGCHLGRCKEESCRKEETRRQKGCCQKEACGQEARSKEVCRCQGKGRSQEARQQSKIRCQEEVSGSRIPEQVNSFA